MNIFWVACDSQDINKRIHNSYSPPTSVKVRVAQESGCAPGAATRKLPLPPSRRTAESVFARNTQFTIFYFNTFDICKHTQNLTNHSFGPFRLAEFANRRTSISTAVQRRSNRRQTQHTHSDRTAVRLS